MYVAVLPVATPTKTTIFLAKVLKTAKLVCMRKLQGARVPVPRSWRAQSVTLPKFCVKTISKRKISPKSGNQLLIYGQKTIISMAAVRHLAF